MYQQKGTKNNLKTREIMFSLFIFNFSFLFVRFQAEAQTKNQDQKQTQVQEKTLTHNQSQAQSDKTDAPVLQKKESHTSQSSQPKSNNQAAIVSANGQVPIATQLPVLFLSAAYSRPMIDQEDGQFSDDLSYQMAMIKKMGQRNQLSAYLGFNQNLQSSEKADFTDIKIQSSFNHDQLLFKNPGFAKLSITLPLSKNSLYKDDLKVGTQVSLGLTPQSELVDISFWTTLRYNHYQYETDKEGNILNPFVVSEGLSLGRPFGKFYVYADFLALQYQNFNQYINYSYQFSQILIYQAAKKIQIQLGHSNAAQVFKSNFDELNLSLIDKNTSQVFISLEFTI